MKKLLTLLLTLLMVLTLVACNSKKEEPTPTVDEPVVVEKQEEEVKQEEPVIVEETKQEDKEDTTTKEEVKTILNDDVTQMSFWVVFYDQYGNELQREALKYGTTPTYKANLPKGFEKWVYKKSQKDANISKAITGNTYYQAICHEVKHHSSGSTPTPSVPVPNKGDIIYLNNEGKSYRVLKVDGTKIKVLAMHDTTEMKFDSETTNTTYAGSDLDNYLNGETDGCFYYSLSDAIKSAIVPQNIVQKFYDMHGSTNSQTNDNYYNFESVNPNSQLYIWYENTNESKEVGQRKVFTLGIEDIIEYFDGSKVIGLNPLLQMFYNSNYSELGPNGQTRTFDNAKSVWLSSYFENSEWPAYEIYALYMDLDFATVLSRDLSLNYSFAVRPAFVVDLAGGLEWSTSAPQQR